jgi:hypothetical protein
MSVLHIIVTKFVLVLIRISGHPSLSNASSSLIKGLKMLETIVVILVVMWLLGMVTSYTMGGLIHILLVIAVVVILLRLIQGRRL